MMDYAIVIIAPEKYAHSEALREVGLLLKHSLISLGKTCELYENEIFEDRLNIILGYHLLSPADIAGIPWETCIIYQLAQLSEIGGAISEEIELGWREARSVWDCSLENIEIFKTGEIDARHLPIGYHPALETIKPAAEQDIDVLFYGSLNDRRSALIDELKEGARVETLFGSYGKERDSIIGRSKIILNVHFFENQVMEQPRVSFLINNGCFVVSEASPEDPYPECMVTAGYWELANICKYYVERTGERSEVARAGFEQFKSAHLMTESLSAVLEAAEID